MEIAQKKIIVISGPSGVGKTTLYKQILELFSEIISFSISATTRPMRNGEICGKDYYFLNEKQFHKLIKEKAFVEWEQVHGKYYGTLKTELDRICHEGKLCLLDLDVNGGIHIKEIFGAQAFLIFIAPPSIEELEKRLKLRDSNDEQSIQYRLSNAREEIRKQNHYDYVLVNKDINESLNRLETCIRSIIKA